MSNAEKPDEPLSTYTALAKLTPDMTREQKRQLLLEALAKNGIKVHPSRGKADGKGAS